MPTATDHSTTDDGRRDRIAGRWRDVARLIAAATGRRRPPVWLVVGLTLAVLGGCGGGNGAADAAGEGKAAPPPRALEEPRIAAAAGDSDSRGVDSAAAPATDGECPMSGLWRSCSVRERLERSGFVVVPASDSVGQPGLGISGSAYRLGSAELQLYLYADSADARRQEASLDTAAARPAGASGVLRAPAVIRSNNLLALLFNNNDRQLERVQLALTAGLPAR
ncbi:MAG: hypothetical protein ACYC2G_03480 [Gemmatimonadaceae bacterium]